nr:phosphoribosylglycinamide formyltransferase [Negativicutes bacterium]
GSNLQAILDAIDTKHIKGNISVVISDKSDIYALERLKGKTIASKIVLRADYTSKEEFEDHLIQVLIDHNVELVVLAGFLRVLGSKFIQEFNNRIINIHPSLLPAFPGLHSPKQALDYGVKFAGCTVHYVNEEVDGGPIIMQSVVPVLPEDDEDSLASRILVEEHQILTKAVQLHIEDRLKLNGRIVTITEGIYGV